MFDYCESVECRLLGLLPRNPLVPKRKNLDGPRFNISLEATTQPFEVIQIRGHGLEPAIPIRWTRTPRRKA